MQDHLLVVRNGDTWSLSGLIDFEPSMVGDPEYDFASVALFVAVGDGSLFRAFFEGYGYSPDELTDALKKRIMGYILTHRYSSLTWFMSFMPGSGTAGSIEDLERAWLSFQD